MRSGMPVSDIRSIRRLSARAPAVRRGNRTGCKPNKRQADQRQHNGGLEACMNVRSGRPARLKKSNRRLPSPAGCFQQHHFPHHTEAYLRQRRRNGKPSPAWRRRAGQRQQDAHIDGGLDETPPSAIFNPEGVKPNLAGVTHRHASPKERHGHKRHNDQRNIAFGFVVSSIYKVLSIRYLFARKPSDDRTPPKNPATKTVNAENYAGQNRQIKQRGRNARRAGDSSPDSALIHIGTPPRNISVRGCRRGCIGEREMRKQHRDQVQDPFHRAFGPNFRLPCAGAVVDDLLAMRPNRPAWPGTE